MRVKHCAALLVAVLVLVPTLSRAQRKLEPRNDQKPTASFRDVDRPPELNLVPADHTTTAVAESEPVFVPVSILDIFEQPLPTLIRSSRADTLRAPPSLL